ncbi:uncharacterized protein LOC106665161 isoform X4 [Cimex lectularius]|uniref:Uncharacterized protein n=1 Tax=Cimex lectularius TaxID=79782 RepID=A0A8I6RRL9_CIMLE|nr:uncharacterized protein LOC106665161 isoform X4 [Cimex lectularius]
MKKVLNFVKGKKDDKKDQRANPQISVEITNPSGQKITTDDEHIIGLQQGYGYNIDVNGKDKSLSKIHKAAWYGNLDKLKLHSKKIDINTPDYLSRTCLHLAVAQGHTEVAWYLLNNNASITACDHDGLTPFLKAVECGHKDCTNLLIECGVDVNCCDKQGNTALHIAARSGFYNIASLLLKEGANINVSNNAGEFALHMATNCDHREMVELLIRYSANVDVLDRERRTPLMLAARNGFSTIIKVLIDSGALLDAADSNGWTAEDYAQFGGHQDLVDLLKVLKNEDVALDHSDKLSVQSSDPSEHVNFENIPEQSETNEEIQDSPKSCVIPPALEPPKSWDLIQSGVIDQDGVERRKGMLTLTLKRDECGSSELVSPSALSPAGDFIPTDMRLSPDPNKELVPTPERRTRSPLERAHSLDLSSDQDSPIQERKNEDFEVKIVHEILKEKPNSDNNNTVLLDNTKPTETFLSANNNNELNTTKTDLNLNNQTVIEDNVKKSNDEKMPHMETCQSYDNLEERSYETGVSASLDNLDDIDGKSLSIEIIQSTGNLDETLSICTVPTKNLFRESHSLELLENNTDDSKSYKNKRHNRNKSITLSGQPQFWKSVDVLHKPASFDKGSIDAQLVCYDEALRQLAKVTMPKPKEPLKLDQEINLKIEDKSSTMQERNHNNSIDFDNVEEIADMSMESGIQFISYPDQSNDNELDSLERDTVFPPPPIHFLQNDDNEIIGLHCEENHEILEVSLPPPISMLTPIKENQQETDSVSINADSNASESSTDQIIPLNQYNELPSCESPQYLVDDVFVEDGQIPESYDKYFVDVKALNIQPAIVDLSQVLFPANSPSPNSKQQEQNNNSAEVRDDKPSSKFPSLNFVIGGICNVSCNRTATGLINLDKSDSESEPVTRPLKRKRKLLLAMRGAGVGGSKDTDNDIDDVEDIDEDSDEEDPPFWHSTEKGGYFIRQNTVVPVSLVEADEATVTSKGEYQLAGPSQSQVRGTGSGSSEGETASASDTPKHSTSPLPIKGPLHPFHCEAFAEKEKLEETAASLLNKAERLKYELEDCRQAEASRDDKISILQTQLTRLECRYAKAQEELCMLRQRASTAEHELNHLRELCSNLTRDKAEMYKELSKQFDIASLYTNADQTDEVTDGESPQSRMHFMIKHLEEAKRQEEEKTQRLVHHLEEVLLTNQSMLSEREALIAQNIADVQKLQEDTICWKERYEELAAKLEMVENHKDPRLIEAQDTIATLKRTITILQQEKSLINPRLFDAATSTSSPKTMSLPAKNESQKISDSALRVTKTTLEYVYKELTMLKTQINQTMFVEVRNQIASNKSLSKSENEKMVQAIDLELNKIKSLGNQIDMLSRDLKQRIEMEGDLDEFHTRLEKSYVSKFEHECTKLSQDEAMKKLKHEAIIETKTQLNDKLNEINNLIQHQIQEQSRQEKARSTSEVSLRKKLEHIGEVLQTELNNIQAVLAGNQVDLKENNEKIKEDSKNKYVHRKRNMFEKTCSLDERIEKGPFKPLETSPKHGIGGNVVKAKQSLEEKMNEDLKEKYLKKK